jgi:uncharacterized protein YcfJ
LQEVAMRAWRRLSCAVAVVAGLAACQGQVFAGRQDAGRVLGLVAGGVAGAALGDGVGQAAAAAVGAIAGMLLGGAIGRDLDALDLIKIDQARLSALEGAPGHTAVWTSEHTPATRGSATAVSSGSERGGGPCRTVREVIQSEGREAVEVWRYCRAGADGRWTRAS